MELRIQLSRLVWQWGAVLAVRKGSLVGSKSSIKQFCMYVTLVGAIDLHRVAVRLVAGFDRGRD